MINYQLMRKIGLFLKNLAKQRMDKKSYGRVYMIHGQPHITSVKGEPPNNLTGALNKSIDFKVKNNEVIIGGGDSNINYMVYLEGDKLQRFNLKNIVNYSQKDINKILEKDLNDMITRLLKK